jgi:hypothetical protein
MKNETAVPVALEQEGLRQLAQARNTAMAEVVRELQSTIPAWQSAQRLGELPSDAPEWMLRAFTQATRPDGSACWQTIQKHFSEQARERIADMPLGENVTGASLAAFLGVELGSFAAEGWERLADKAQEVRHV